MNGTSEQVIIALKMISDKLRALLSQGHAGSDRSAPRGQGDRDRPERGDSKRSRGPERDGGHQLALGMLHAAHFVELLRTQCLA